MMSLIPEWARNSESFWNSVKERNLWFIKLRYGAVALLLFLIITLELLLKFPLTRVQVAATTIIAACILTYNIVIHRYRKAVKPENKFNNLHLSLLQMVLDLSALTLLIHYSGGVETPIFMFYIFHMIIGSMILPEAVIYSVALGVILVFNIITLTEYYGIIPHHPIIGLLSTPIYNDLNYLLVLQVVFSMMMVISVLLANKIASQLYQREHELWVTLNKLKEAEAEKQRYIIGVVHEIKTPVAAVQSILDIVLQRFLGPVSEDIAEKLRRARIRTDESIKLINNVLHISRIKLLDQITYDAINISELIQEVIEKHNIQAEIKSICIKMRTTADQIPCIPGDKALLEIAFSNLIGNAVKYNNPGGLVEISVVLLTDNVMIKICDNGIGIPAEDIKNVFNEFYRASNSRNFKFEGSGMGLTVVKQIITRHHGQISIESPSELQDSKKPGTCITVTLPVQKEDHK